MKLSQRTMNSGGLRIKLLRAGIAMLTLAAALITLFAWAAATPAQSSPDDDYHLPSIWCRGAGHAELCELVSQEEIPSHHRLNPYGDVGVEIVTPPIACYRSPATADESCTGPSYTFFRMSDWLYPPLFYNALSVVSGENPYENQISMRLVAGGGVVCIFALSYFAASARFRQAALISWVIASVPMGLLFYVSTNPSSWAIAGLAAMWPVALTCFLDESIRRRALAAGVWALAATMAAGSRGDAAIFVFLFNLVAIVLLWRSRRQLLAVIIAVTLSLASLTFFLLSGQSRAAAESFGEVAERTPLQVIWSFILAYPSLFFGTAGEPWGLNNATRGAGGWFDIVFQPTTWILMLVVLGALLFKGLGYLNTAKSLALLAILFIAGLVPLRAMLQSGIILGEAFQPRYLFPLFILFAGIMLVRPDAQWLKVSATQAVVIWLMMAVTSAVALHSVISRFVHGPDELEPNLNANIIWWGLDGISPMTLWLLGTVAWSLILAVSMLHLVDSRAFLSGSSNNAEFRGQPVVAGLPVSLVGNDLTSTR